MNKCNFCNNYIKNGMGNVCSYNCFINECKKTKGEFLNNQKNETNFNLNSIEIYKTIEPKIKNLKNDYEKFRNHKKDLKIKSFCNEKRMLSLSMNYRIRKIRNIKIKYSSKIYNLLNYSHLDLKEHLEKKFLPEMNWENYGNYWVIDHIKPLFYCKNLNDVFEYFKLENLQPLPEKINIKKMHRYIFEVNNIPKTKEEWEKQKITNHFVFSH